MKKLNVFIFSVLIFFATVFLLNSAKLENIRSVTVEDFNEEWTYKTSPNNDVEKTKLKIVNAGARNAALLPGKQEAEKKSLAFKTGFYNKGYNWIAFYPKKPIVLPGRAKKIQIWLLGMKYNYRLEIYLKDYLGFVHKIDMGSINFEGWKSLIRDIPSSIPQQESNYPKDRPLSIVKIVLRADPYERADRFYIFLDQINVYCDVYQKFFDGIDLINKTDWE